MIKYSMRKAINRAVSSLLLIIQLPLSILLLLRAFNLSIDYSFNEALITDLYGSTSFAYMRDTSDQDYLMRVTANQPDTVKRQEELYTWFKNQESFKLLSCQNYDLCVYRDFFAAPNAVSHDLGDSTLFVQGFRADKDFFERFPLQISRGRVFNSEEFISAEILPVILGAGYLDYYKLGDKIALPENPMQTAKYMEVVGFCEPQSYIACPFIPERALVADNFIVYPFVKPYDKASFEDYDMLIFQSILITDNAKQAEKLINAKMKELGLYQVSVYGAFAPKGHRQEAASNNRAISAVTVAVALIFTCCTAYSVLSMRFRLRKNDYNIFWNLGASRTKITLCFLAETAPVFFISAIIAWLIGRKESYNAARICLAFLAFSLIVIIISVSFYFAKKPSFRQEDKEDRL